MYRGAPDKLSMIGHPAIHMQACIEAFERRRDDLLEYGAILCRGKQVFSMVATKDHMVTTTPHMQSGKSWHPCHHRQSESDSGDAPQPYSH